MLEPLLLCRLQCLGAARRSCTTDATQSYSSERPRRDGQHGRASASRVRYCVVHLWVSLGGMFIYKNEDPSRVVHIECEIREAMSIRHRKRILHMEPRAAAYRVRRCRMHPKPVTPVGLHAGPSVRSLSDWSKNGVANVVL